MSRDDRAPASSTPADAAALLDQTFRTHGSLYRRTLRNAGMELLQPGEDRQIELHQRGPVAGDVQIHIGKREGIAGQMGPVLQRLLDVSQPLGELLARSLMRRRWQFRMEQWAI